MNNIKELLSNINVVSNRKNNIGKLIGKLTKLQMVVPFEGKERDYDKYVLNFLPYPGNNLSTPFYDKNQDEIFGSVYPGDDTLTVSGEFGKILTDHKQDISLYKEYHKQIINNDDINYPLFIENYTYKDQVIINEFKSNTLKNIKYPYEKSNNKYMIYVIQPNGNNFTDKQKFLEEIKKIAKNIIDATEMINRPENIDGDEEEEEEEEEEDGDVEYPIDTVRIFLYGLNYDTLKITKKEIAEQIIRGIAEVIDDFQGPRKNKRNGGYIKLKHIEFAYDNNAFWEAYDEIKENIFINFKKQGISFEDVREYIRKNPKVIMGEGDDKMEIEILKPTEELIEIKDDGYCLYGTLAKIIYNASDDVTTIRVQREIIQYMLKVSFGDEYAKNHQKYYDDFVKGINIPPLLIGQIKNDTISDFWKQQMDINKYVPLDKKNKDLNIKVAYVIADFMKGLPEINPNPQWGDLKIMPTLASELYEISLCILVIDRNKQNKIDVNNCDDGSSLLIKHSLDKIPKKLAFYTKHGEGKHFDAIVPKNHQSLHKEALVASKLA